ncbi:MAG TPA: PQQ-binding-like beta-propeller repeat protein [Rhodothermales bacterium]|nr:PQQ-binding-like beta-propeller repeat protein [Rhodothermales bacterium]
MAFDLIDRYKKRSSPPGQEGIQGWSIQWFRQTQQRYSPERHKGPLPARPIISTPSLILSFSLPLFPPFPLSSFLPLSLLLLTLAGCGSLKLNTPTAGANDWPTEGASARRQYAPLTEIAPPLELVWDYNASAAFGPGSPLIIGNAVIIATRQGEIQIVEFKTGKRRGVKGFGDAVEGTPAFKDGILFIPGAWGGRALYAYGLNRGDLLWSVKGDPVETGVLISSGNVVVVDAAPRIAAYAPRTGTLKWERRLDPGAAVLASPVAIGENAFAVANEDGLVTALDGATGKVLWTADAGAPVQSTPSSRDSLLFLPTTRGQMVALDTHDGHRVWAYDIHSQRVYFSSPAASDSGLVFGASDGKVRALDPRTGTLKWAFDGGEAFSAAPLITRNVVYVGGLDGKLYALKRSDGTKLWDYELDGRVKSALASRGDYIVVASEPKNVYLFKASDPDYAENK